ncbi:MAG: hypothetical protein QXL57_03310 [Candidatus Bathyarchaeia archaeon]
MKAGFRSLGNSKRSSPQPCPQLFFCRFVLKFYIGMPNRNRTLQELGKDGRQRERGKATSGRQEAKRHPDPEPTTNRGKNSRGSIPGGPAKNVQI